MAEEVMKMDVLLDERLEQRRKKVQESKIEEIVDNAVDKINEGLVNTGVNMITKVLETYEPELINYHYGLDILYEVVKKIDYDEWDNCLSYKDLHEKTMSFIEAQKKRPKACPVDRIKNNILTGKFTYRISGAGDADQQYHRVQCARDDLFEALELLDTMRPRMKTEPHRTYTLDTHEWLGYTALRMASLHYKRGEDDENQKESIRYLKESKGHLSKVIAHNPKNDRAKGELNHVTDLLEIPTHMYWGL